MAQRTNLIPEKQNRLGRHIEHDARSLSFPSAKASSIKTVMHRRHCEPFDQGNLGSCTGNAMAGCLMTTPYHKKGVHLTERDAIRLYTQASHLDDIPGEYPPFDTGSSGLGVAKAAKLERRITAYQHAFGLQHVLESLTLAPGILGIDWYSSFDAPLSTGECPLTEDAEVRGGHEIQMFGIEAEAQRVWCVQSWGPEWGGLKNGLFWFSFATLDRLLKQQGDAVFFHG